MRKGEQWESCLLYMTTILLYIIHDNAKLLICASAEKFERNEDLETHFSHIKNQFVNTIENTNYTPKLETRVKCNASHTGLRAY